MSPIKSLLRLITLPHPSLFPNYFLAFISTQHNSQTHAGHPTSLAFLAKERDLANCPLNFLSVHSNSINLDSLQCKFLTSLLSQLNLHSLYQTTCSHPYSHTLITHTQDNTLQLVFHSYDKWMHSVFILINHEFQVWESDSYGSFSYHYDLKHLTWVLPMAELNHWVSVSLRLWLTLLETM
jgi:hypothetical protein